MGGDGDLWPRRSRTRRAAFADWLAEPPGPEQIRYPLLLTLAFGASLDTGTLLGYISAHRPMHEQRLAAYEAPAASGGLDRYQQATAGFGLHCEQAVLAWMAELPAHNRCCRSVLYHYPASPKRLRTGGRARSHDRGRYRAHMLVSYHDHGGSLPEADKPNWFPG